MQTCPPFLALSPRLTLLPLPLELDFLRFPPLRFPALRFLEPPPQSLSEPLSEDAVCCGVIRWMDRSFVLDSAKSDEETQVVRLKNNG